MRMLEAGWGQAGKESIWHAREFRLDHVSYGEPLNF